MCCSTPWRPWPTRKADPSTSGSTANTTNCPRTSATSSPSATTGPGIPDAIKDRVLEPFFTTKKEGTGLGLYISYSIMKTLKGDLEIHSSGQGTRVNLILPAR